MNGLKSIFKEDSKTLIFVILGIFFIFFISLDAPIDPDFGWHWHNGSELLKNHTISHLDQDSFTMNDYQWVCFSWISDLFIVLFPKIFGFFGLSVFFSLVAGAAFLLAARAYKSNIVLQIIIAMFGAILSVSTLGVRDQVWSILGLAVLIFILLRWRANQQNKIIWFVPLLFAVWTNLHAGIATGLGTMLVFFFLESWKQRSMSKKLIPIFIISLLATFVNPYGPRIYQETWATLIDFSGRFQIIEWRPIFFAGWDVLLPALIYGLCLMGAQFYSKKRDLTLIIISGLFFVFALTAWRNLPLFFIASSPLAVLTLKNFIGKNLLDMIKIPTILMVIFVLTFFIGWRNIRTVWALDADLRQLAQEAEFPYHAVIFLSNKMPQIDTSRLLNEYNWGGYILWQMPGQKVFIDGKMPHWKSPGRNIFADYLTLQTSRDTNKVDTILKKYDINSALIRSDSPLVFYLSAIGWKEIYQDSLATILQK